MIKDSDTKKYLEEVKAYTESIINLVLSGACQKKNLIPECESLLISLSNLEKILDK